MACHHGGAVSVEYTIEHAEPIFHSLIENKTKVKLCYKYGKKIAIKRKTVGFAFDFV